MELRTKCVAMNEWAWRWVRQSGGRMRGKVFWIAYPQLPTG